MLSVCINPTVDSVKVPKEFFDQIERVDFIPNRNETTSEDTIVKSKAFCSPTISIETLRGPQKDHSIKITVSITFEECAKGTQKIVQYQRLVSCPSCKSRPLICSLCSSQGFVASDHRVAISVPPGVHDKSLIIFKGDGNEFISPDDFTLVIKSDLYVSFRLSKHPLFSRSSLNVELSHTISMVRAALGSREIIPTIYGSNLVCRPSFFILHPFIFWV